MLPMQVVTHSQRFASRSETVLRLDRGQIAYIGAPSEDPFRLWGPEPSAAQVAFLKPVTLNTPLCVNTLYSQRQQSAALDAFCTRMRVEVHVCRMM